MRCVDMVSKKGQGLSLNVIIIAAIALVVMVILIVIFVGQTGKFEKQVGEEADTTLFSMRAAYGDCHPGVVDEVAFKAEYTLAAVEQSEQEQANVKGVAKEKFQDKIDQCRQAGADKISCENGDCKWS